MENLSSVPLATKDLKIIRRALDYTYTSHTLEEVEKDKDLEWMSCLEHVLEEKIKKREEEETKREIIIIIENGVVSGIHGLDKDQTYKIIDEYTEEREPEGEKEVVLELFNGYLNEVKNLKNDQWCVVYDLD